MCKFLKDLFSRKRSNEGHRRLIDSSADQKIPSYKFSLRSSDNLDKEKRKVEAVNLGDVYLLINTINGKEGREHNVVELLNYIGSNIKDFEGTVYVLQPDHGGIVFYFDAEHYKFIKSENKGYDLVFMDNLALGMMLQKFCGLSQKDSEEYADRHFDKPRTGYDIDR